MARIRTIKPEYWVDEKVVELSPWARLLFIGLWNFADDQGYIDYAPKRIKMQVFPGDTTDVVPLIDELLAQGVVWAWRSPIGPVLQIINWGRHQRVDHPAKARFDPADLVSLETPESSRDPRDTLARPLGIVPRLPPNHDAPSSDENDHQISSRGLASGSDEPFPTSPAPAAPNSESVIGNPREDSRTLAPEGKGREGKGVNTSSTSSPKRARATDDPNFDRFWAAYPRKEGKKDAHKAWPAAVKAASGNADTIITAAERYRDRRRGQDPKFTKTPAAWLNGERWNDEPPTVLRVVGSATGGAFWDN